MSMPDLSVLIVTWNVRQYALDCLRSVEAARGALDVEVIVVDNGSTDGTAAAIRAAFPAVRVLEPGANLGFPRANNLAASVAHGRHILFLNPDCVVGPDALRACVEELDRNSDAGIVGCRLVYGDGAVQRECGRRIYRLRHLATEVLFLNMLFPSSRLFGHHLMGDWDHADDRDVEAVSGAFMMARREVVEALGGLPTEMFMYHEDMAFCLRALRAGWRVRLLGSVTSTHHGGRSSGQRLDAGMTLLSGEYKLRLIREHQGSIAAIAARPLFALRCATRIAAALGLRFIPGGERVRRGHRAFDLAGQWLLLRWAVAPALVARYALPAAAAEAADRPAAALADTAGVGTP